MASSWQRDPASRRFRVCCVLFVVCECFSGRLRCFGISDGLGLLIFGFIDPKGPGISLGGSGISWGEPLGLFGVSETLHFEVPQFVRTLRGGLGCLGVFVAWIWVFGS